MRQYVKGFEQAKRGIDNNLTINNQFFTLGKRVSQKEQYENKIKECFEEADKMDSYDFSDKDK